MRRTHVDTGYPVYWPSDPEGFLLSSAEHASWVVLDDDGHVIGHAALHDAKGDPAFGPAHELTGLPAETFLVVARLVIDPDAQGTGAGTALLDAAVHHALAAGKHPILDVVTTSPKAIAFYDARGWTRLGEAVIEIDELPDLTTIVFAAPGLVGHP